MEIREIVSYFFNSETNIIEVSFRTISDGDEMIRIDNLDYSIAEDYGFNLISETFDFFGDDLEEDIFEDDDVQIDEGELLLFLNEYYSINPEKLPKEELY